MDPEENSFIEREEKERKKEMEMDISDVNKEWTKSAGWKCNWGIQETILDFYFIMFMSGGGDCVEEYYDIHFERWWQAV